MINAVTSFFENAKEKLTNPFFGTLILVWLVRNWELAYTLFNFDDDCNLNDKKSFIISYFQSKSFYCELFSNVGIAMTLMLFGYLLIIITRVIINVIENNLMPFLNKKTVSKLVTNIGIHESVIKQRDEFFEKYGLERDKAREAVRAYDSLKISSENESEDYQNKIDILENQVSLAEDKIDELENKIITLNEGTDSQKKLVKQLENTLQIKDKELIEVKIRLLRTIEDMNGVESLMLAELQRNYLDNLKNGDDFQNIGLKELLDELKQKKTLDIFIDFTRLIDKKSESTFSSNHLEEFINMRLFRYKDSISKKLNSSSNVELTGIGKILALFAQIQTR